MALWGVIGGSGVYDLDGLESVSWQSVSSSFGEPSDQLMFGKLIGTDVVFLPRHGRGHKLSPTEINYRANIDALKRVGVTDVISVSAVGSLKEHLDPGTFVSWISLSTEPMLVRSHSLVRDALPMSLLPIPYAVV
jgi:5'-methylthioadenosine phosphorylase